MRRAAGAFSADIVLAFAGRAASFIPRGNYAAIGRLGGYYNLKNFAACDYLVCNAPDLVRYVVAGGWDESKVFLIPNFPSVPDGPALDRATLGTPKDAPLAVALGRLHRNKGLDVLLRAVALVPELVVWIAGEGPERDALEKLARDFDVSERVKFLGWRNDRAGLYKAADVCVYPSREEPFGNVVVEAWLCGVPIVTTASTGPAWLARNGEDAILTPIDDAAAACRSDPQRGCLHSACGAFGRRGEAPRGGRVFGKCYREALCRSFRKGQTLMCGIAGVMTSEATQPNAALLDGFLRALSHRGPDGEGRYAAPGVGLVQTRLAIIDLSTGDQPLYGSNGTALVANGEIYNYVELKREFSANEFKTQSDCEVPLAAYARDGADFAKDLRGMYAIALHDARDHALYLSRDPFGIKPLYYAEISGGIVFASELQAILKSNLLAAKIRPEAANELVQLQFTTGRTTIFDGIHRVAPGETLTLRGGRIVGRRQKHALAARPALKIGETEALEIARCRADGQRCRASTLRCALWDVPFRRHRFGDCSCLHGAAE